MSRAVRVTLGIFGFYSGASLLCVAKPFLPFSKAWSWKMPQNSKTKPLSEAQKADTAEMQRRDQLEQSMVRMFHFVQRPDDINIVDDNCEFEDPYGSRKGRDAVETIIFGFQRIVKEHTMENIEIERYANAFTLKFDQTAKMFFLPAVSMSNIVYCELNEDNTKVTKCFDYWYGKPFLNGLGLGALTRKINGKLWYGYYLQSLQTKT